MYVYVKKEAHPGRGRLAGIRIRKKDVKQETRPVEDHFIECYPQAAVHKERWRERYKAARSYTLL